MFKYFPCIYKFVSTCDYCATDFLTEQNDYSNKHNLFQIDQVVTIKKCLLRFARDLVRVDALDTEGDGGYDGDGGASMDLRLDGTSLIRQISKKHWNEDITITEASILFAMINRELQTKMERCFEDNLESWMIDNKPHIIWMLENGLSQVRPAKELANFSSRQII